MELAIAALLTLLALGAAGWAHATRRTMQVMEETPTTPCGGVKGPGYYEVKGRIECGSPLHSPGSGTPCVYYRHLVKEKVEESYRDSKGEWRTRTKWRTLSDNNHQCSFTVRDRTGSLAIDPTGASFDATQSSSVTTGGRDTSWSAEMGAMFGYWATESQGQREEVWALELGQDLYALGRVTRAGSGLVLGRDEEGGKPFVLSNRSEEEQLASHAWSFRLAVLAALACLVGAGICLHQGLLR